MAGTLKYLLGAPGIAFLWVRPGLEHPRDPVLTGWFGRKEPFAFTPKVLDYNATARRFQTGTPAIPAAFAASAGLSLINEISVAKAFHHVEALAQRAQDALSEQGWQFFSPADPQYRGPQVTIHAEDAERIAAHLSSQRIFVSPRGDAVRISLHFYNNQEDIDRVVDALRSYRRQGTRDQEGGEEV
ncbi:MAG: aminotransferase class V-fold PLP-dependent enzyme [Thermaerobacter sp.]|nr:aminotransferase class V-fold PLP-dependent enzyme [Thermaerobacter sp.]